MIRKYKDYTNSQMIDAIKKSTSIAQVLRKLNLVPKGGNYETIKRFVIKNHVDISHFKGQGWNKGLTFKQIKELTSPTTLRKRILKERQHKCSTCKRSTWLGSPIILEVDHIDGNRFNNNTNNIRLLCPNCHSYTPTWRGRKNNNMVAVGVEPTNL